VLLEEHRRELHVHSYRMLGSLEDAEDLVQETCPRAWRGRSGSASATGRRRAWLYRIATNACLDFLAAEQGRAPLRVGARGAAEVAWLQPYADRMLASRWSATDHRRVR
jgi:RNA polymerase sigma-70 factor (ECF subfamily)